MYRDMVRNNDPMTDDTRFYELKRSVDKLENRMGVVEDRQEKHEKRFSETFAELSKAVVNIDKKLDVFCAQIGASSNAAEKLWKYGIPLLVTIIGGFWIYDGSIHQTIHEQKTPIQVEPTIVLPPQIKK